MDTEQRQHLRDLLRAHQSQLRVLELQAATFGAHAPPHVLTEIDRLTAVIADIEAQLGQPTPAVSRAALRQLRQQAFAAYYAETWEHAEDLLIQIVQADPADQDAQAKLDHTQRQLDLRAFYQAIVELREDGNRRAVLAALADLDQRQPNYPGTAELREWAVVVDDYPYDEAQPAVLNFVGRQVVEEQRVYRLFGIPIFSRSTIKIITLLAFIILCGITGWTLPVIRNPIMGVVIGTLTSTTPISIPTMIPTETLPPPVTPLPSLTPLPFSIDFFNIYTDAGASGNHFTPSGKMGDIGDIDIVEDWMVNPHSGTTAIKVIYDTMGRKPFQCGLNITPTPNCQWAGIYWQDPANNSGITPPNQGGFNLIGFRKLTFWARSDAPITIQFKVGGSGSSAPSPPPWPSSLSRPKQTGLLTLTQQWQRFEIDLSESDLSYVIDGFAWVANWPNNEITARTPKKLVFYLDDIRFER